MAKIDYLHSVASVAEDHGGINSFERLSKDLFNRWIDLEVFLQARHYNVFDPDPTLNDHLSNLLTLLYRIPNHGFQHDVQLITMKDRDYGGSWQKRGGQGAFMMLARKWDRIEKQIDTKGSLEEALRDDTRTEGISDDFTDLRGYLILVLAYRRSERNSIYVPEVASSSDDMPF